MYDPFTHLNKDFLTLYEKGGGTPAPPPDHTLEVEQMRQQDEQRNREWQAQQSREAQEREDRKTAQAKADQDRETAERRAKNSSRRGAAYAAALGAGDSMLGAKGLAGSSAGANISARVNQSLSRIMGSLDDDVDNPGEYLSDPSIFTDAYEGERATQKKNLKKQLGGFAGAGFERRLFADTDDDAILNSILDDQYKDADTAIQSAFARGQINDSGLASARSGLSKQKTSGLSKLQDLGLGILGGYRNQATDYIRPYQSQVDNYDLGDEIDLDGAASGLSGLGSSLKGRMSGDILAAVGDTKYLDTDTLLAKAANASGVLNGNGSTASGFGGLSGGTLSTSASPTVDQDPSKRQQGNAGVTF